MKLKLVAALLLVAAAFGIVVLSLGGLWIQTVALVVALPCAIVALVGQRWTGAPPGTGEPA